MQDTIKTTPAGMFTDRNIYGNWVSGDGMVYKDFDGNKNFIDDIKDYNFKRYIAGVDWGYGHYGAIVVFGITEDNDYIMIDEVAETQKEIDWWANEAKKLNKKYPRLIFYCDSARVEHIDRFINDGLDARLASKKVIEGIEQVAILYKTCKLFIFEPVAKRFKEEIYSYVWETNTTTDQIKKEYDDVMDAMRYAIYTDMKDGGGKIKTFRGDFI